MVRSERMREVRGEESKAAPRVSLLTPHSLYTFTVNQERVLMRIAERHARAAHHCSQWVVGDVDIEFGFLFQTFVESAKQSAPASEVQPCFVNI